MTTAERLDRVVAARARSDADATAVVAGDATLTYGALNSLADQMAAALAARGVGAGMLVGLSADRSAAALAALLAVWKLGAAYVPLDPQVPPARRAKLAGIAGVFAAVAESQLDVPGLIPLDELAEDARRRPASPMDAPVGAEALAYGIFTSGSTGGPKCVLVEHRSLWHLAQGLAQTVYAGVDRRLRVGVNGPLAFDTSVKQLVRLAAGDELHLVPADVRPDAARFRQFLQSHAVDVIDVTPTQARSWLHHGVLDGLPTTLLLGGESVDAGLWRALAARAAEGGGRSFNLYGPTECTVDATCAAVAGDTPTIGLPLPHVTVHLVDRHGRPVPPWVRGEIVIGGEGVARGYAGGSADDHARFCADPGTPGGRLFRTGDFARRRPTGEIEFLSRDDDQVKVAGVRIELGEVEAELEGLPDVVAAAAAVRHEGGTAVLVAAVVGARPDVDGAAVRAALVDRLPSAMVPASVRVVPELPRTPNGKLDRAAVAAAALDVAASPGAPPGTDTERCLARAFADVLGLAHVDIDSSFFALGGDSFQAVQLTGQAAEALGRDVPLRLVFLHPTVRELAAALDAVGAFRQGLAVVGQTPRTTGAGTRPGRAVVERRPLLGLVAAGRLPGVDAAAIACLPPELRAFGGADVSAAVAELTGGLPLLASIRTTPAGRLATVLIPRFDEQLSPGEQPAVVREVVEAMTLAGAIGARAVSLTGALPDATGLGRAVAGVSPRGLPQLTIGHPATAAAVVIALRRLMDSAALAPHEHVLGVLGTGSVGAGALELALLELEHPRRIVLCDSPSRSDRMATLASRLADRYGYSGEIVRVPFDGAVPAELAACTAVVSTLRAPGALDRVRLAPGALVVDYSSGALDPAASDGVLYANGGVVASPSPIEDVRYVPAGVEALVGELGVELAAVADPHEITACSLAALLVASEAGAPPVVGAPGGRTCRRYLEALERLAFAPPLRETMVTRRSTRETALAT